METGLITPFQGYKKFQKLVSVDCKHLQRWSLIGKSTEGQLRDNKRKGKSLKAFLLPRNQAIQLNLLVPGAGLEPARGHTPRDFKSHNYISYWVIPVDII